MAEGFWRPAAGWLLLTAALATLAWLLPPGAFDPTGRHYVFAIGLLGLWRYGLRLLHLVRALLFLYWVYPRLRRRAGSGGARLAPSHAYLMVTSFRIDAATTAAVYRSVIEEAIRCGWPTTVVASIVEMADQRLILSLWERYAPPPQVRLKIVRIPGTGKRDGLAQGFRAISRDMPDERAVVAVIDGDTVLEPGVVARTAPYLKLLPTVGALTTNEFCEVEGSHVMREWHKLRFAQRHLSMCSMALTRRVLTLTGRMSLFRASIVTDPEFIDDVENDALQHWRLGRFKFLTGDDKSSWFSLVRLGWETWYVPDAAIRTVEHPPDPRFWVASRQLMFRWYGNSLRQNGRALQLGWRRLGAFTTYVLWDQRISMWTSLLGLSLALGGSLLHGPMVLLAFALWVGLSRVAMTAMLLLSGHRVGPLFPLLLYYNQLVGSLVKIHVFFRLDQQSWTRQKTKLDRHLDGFARWFNPWSSRTLTFSAASLFAALVVALLAP